MVLSFLRSKVGGLLEISPRFAAFFSFSRSVFSGCFFLLDLCVYVFSSRFSILDFLSPLLLVSYVGVDSRS